MLLGRASLLCAALFFTICECQTWQSGDNSTVEGCSSQCSVSDSDLTCWNTTLMYFERILIGQLRHYVAVQVDIDQWHRRHGMKHGQNFTQVRADVESSFLAELNTKDILTPDTVKAVAKTLMDRVETISDHVITWVPHFQCPLPCEYKCTTYRNMFIASIVLNVCLLVAVVPFIVKLMRQEDEWAKETLIPTH